MRRIPSMFLLLQGVSSGTLSDDLEVSTFSATVEFDRDLLVHVLGQVEDVLLLGTLALVSTRATSSATTSPSAAVVASPSSASISAASAASSMASSIGHVA